MIKDKAMFLGSCSSNGLHITSTVSQLGKFDDELPLEAPPGYGSAPTPPVNVDKL